MQELCPSSSSGHGEDGVNVDHCLLSFLAKSSASVNTSGGALVVLVGSTGGVGSGLGVKIGDVGVGAAVGSKALGDELGSLGPSTGPSLKGGVAEDSAGGTGETNEVGFLAGGVMILVVKVKPPELGP